MGLSAVGSESHCDIVWVVPLGSYFRTLFMSGLAGHIYETGTRFAIFCPEAARPIVVEKIAQCGINASVLSLHPYRERKLVRLLAQRLRILADKWNCPGARVLASRLHERAALSGS